MDVDMINNVKVIIENKPWFDDKCIQLRKIYMEKLKLFNATRTLSTETSWCLQSVNTQHMKEDLRFQGD